MMEYRNGQPYYGEAVRTYGMGIAAAGREDVVAEAGPSPQPTLTELHVSPVDAPAPDLYSMTVAGLRALAQTVEIQGYRNMRKAELITALEEYGDLR